MIAVKPESLERARKLHARNILLDSHVDTTQHLAKRDLSIRNENGHLDIPRLHEGGVSAVIFAIWAAKPKNPGDGVRAAREQIESIRELMKKHDADLRPATTAKEIREVRDSGRIAVPIAIEGGYLIEDSLEILRQYREAGAVYLTLTHGFHTTWADSAGVMEDLAPHHGGLTEFGKEVIRELNRIGMLVDVSHVSDDTLKDVLDIAEAPIVATHSSCRAVNDHRRNLPDDLMKEIAATGGVVQINFSAPFIDPEFPTIDPAEYMRWWEAGGIGPLTDYESPLENLIDHFDHAIRLIGPEHVGIGSDFDGVAALPHGMGECSQLPYLTASLFERGYGEKELAPLLGENFLRVMTACGR